MKAIKNDVEIAGTRSAHVRDGAAMVQFLAWFDGEAPKGQLTEIDAVEALESFRRDTGQLERRAVPDDFGAGANGAIVYYRSPCDQHRPIKTASCSCSIPARN